jgi:hypothetical protein
MTGLGNIDDVYKHYLKVIDENQQLKELLRECKGELEYLYKWYSDPNGGSRSELLHKIDNAIGEK